MSMLDDALAVLLDDALAPVVEMVLCAREPDAVEAYARCGSTAFDRTGRVAWTRGRDPLANRDPGAFATLADERSAVRPPQQLNHYPFAHDNLAHLFDDPRAPDIAVVHTAAHNWEERGGHRGEHGSADVIQSRAPLIVAGPGFRPLGRLASAARMVDIAPTLAALLGIGLPAGDGAALEQVLDGCLPERVLVLLLDGSNANVLTAMAEAGELPSIASLMARGTTFGHGLVASFPSVTMANHTTALTGLHPGHHGLLHNAFYDRSSGRSVVTNSPEVWHLAREEMRPGIETIFEALARAGAGPTAAVNEPCDRGATYATFDALRSGAVRTVADALPDASDVPGATRALAEGDLRYGWSSAADHLAVQQAVDLLNGAAGARAPRLLWVNLILTDTAGHIGGPYGDMAHASLRDTDARVAQILRAAGDDEATAVVLLADHGMEESDPHCTGDWKPALRAAGIPVRDEGEGFLYLGA